MLHALNLNIRVRVAGKGEGSFINYESLKRVVPGAKIIVIL